MEELSTLVERVHALYESFKAEADRNVSGNKAAGQRARKMSLEIEKLMKQYRKDSIAAAK